MDETSHLASKNPWSSLSHSQQNGSAESKKKGAHVSNQQNGNVGPNVMKAGSDAIASFKASRGVKSATKDSAESSVPNGVSHASDPSWTNIGSQQQRPKKRENGYRTVSVAEAVADLEAKSREVHTIKLAKRCATWAQWCRRMEDSRADGDIRYVDEENGNAVLSFTEVFLRSCVLEDIVKSAIRNPLSDEAELHYLFSITLHGDTLFHDKLAKGLRTFGEFFQKLQDIPQEVVNQIARIVSSLKMNPACRSKRSDNISLQRLEEQISMNVSKLNALSRPDVPSGTDAKCKTTLELIKLIDEKHTAVKRGLDGVSQTQPEQLTVAVQELLAVISTMREPLTNTKAFAEQQYNIFQAKLKSALAGEDSEYLRVVEIDRGLEAELQGLRTQEEDLRRQLELIGQQISSVQQRQRQHKAQSAKVLATYQERMKAFQGEDSKVLSNLQAAEKSLQLCQSSCDFLRDLSERGGRLVQEETIRWTEAAGASRRQALAYLTLYLEACREAGDMVSRRRRFCADKVEAMRREQREALEMGMADLAADLGAAICRLEQQNDRASTQARGAEVDAALVRRLYMACSQTGPDDAAGETAAQLADVAALMAEVGLEA